MKKIVTVAMLAIAATDLTASTVVGFICPTTPSRRIRRANDVKVVAGKPGIYLAAASNDDEENSNEQDKKDPDPVEAFMEEASLKGADKVKEMSIEERTKRAVLAEAVEDRIFSMYDEIEALLPTGVPASDEDRDEVTSLAKQIKASQSQYENLVTGEPSAMLGAFNKIGKNNSKDNSEQWEYYPLFGVPATLNCSISTGTAMYYHV